MISVNAYSDSLQRAAHRVLDSLDRMDARVGDHYARMRAHPRNDFRGVVTLCVPDPNQMVLRPDAGTLAQVWARSISSSGLSFISPEKLEEETLLIGVDIPGGQTRWFQAEVVRERKHPEESFWEYGVAFRGRATA